MDRLTDVTQLEGWVPARFSWRDGNPIVDWSYFGRQRFEGFFEHNLQNCMARPFNLLFRHERPIEVVEQCHQARAGLKPKGLIFHMSRCGATLISQMLSTTPAT